MISGTCHVVLSEPGRDNNFVAVVVYRVHNNTILGYGMAHSDICYRLHGLSVYGAAEGEKRTCNTFKTND
jgi:hypothetical protein